uniref:Ubiquitin-like domain-containing protein n=1 Tax=Acrobeloides nanus TaxID=290746 RepID=A0A914DXE7_9BILA
MDFYANGQNFHQNFNNYQYPNMPDISSGNWNFSQQLPHENVCYPIESCSNNFMEVVPPKPSRFAFVTILSDHESNFQLAIDLAWKVEQIKKAIQDLVHTPIDQQCLFYQDHQLANDQLLTSYNIQDGSEIQLVIIENSLQQSVFDTIEDQSKILFNPNFFQTEFNADYINVLDDTIPYLRGGYPYKRPIGAQRWGLKVRGRYSPDDKWLGSSGGHRTKSDEGEWAVAYHGTREINATQILQEGFKLECCVRAAFGKGIYCTPDPKTALSYAIGFEFQGSQYRAVLQCRVNPQGFKVARPGSNRDNDGEYWLLTNSDDIRPYGLCIYKNEDIQNNNYTGYRKRFKVPRPIIVKPKAPRGRRKKKDTQAMLTIANTINPSLNNANQIAPNYQMILPQVPLSSSNFGTPMGFSQVPSIPQMNFPPQPTMPIFQDSGFGSNQTFQPSFIPSATPTQSPVTFWNPLSMAGPISSNVQPLLNFGQPQNGQFSTSSTSLAQPCSSFNSYTSSIYPSSSSSQQWSSDSAAYTSSFGLSLLDSSQAQTMQQNNLPSTSSSNSSTDCNLNAGLLSTDFMQKIGSNDYLQAMFNWTQCTPGNVSTPLNNDASTNMNDSKQNDVIDLTKDDDDDVQVISINNNVPSSSTDYSQGQGTSIASQSEDTDDLLNVIHDYIQSQSSAVADTKENADKVIDIIDLTNDDDHNQDNSNSSNAQNSPFNLSIRVLNDQYLYEV